MEMEDDREFTTEEIRQTMKSTDYKKAPGEDGITSKILMWTFEIFPELMTAVYNGCLRKGCFPKRWKRARIIPLTKPGKENCNDASRYRPISLLNVGGKVLEKMLINRIMHFLYSNNLLNQNQFGFSPQKKHYRRGNVSKGLYSRSTYKRTNYSIGQPRRQRCLRRCMVAKYFKGSERSSMSQKLI